MRFLCHTLTWDWCREHGFALDEGRPDVAPRLADDPALSARERTVHAAAGDGSAAQTLAATVLIVLGTWDECLVWATDWDVWENEEDWPRYYAWRGAAGERRSVSAAPGHLFTPGEDAALGWLLAHAIECGWDVAVLPTRAAQPTGRRVATSHDEWVEVRATEPVGFTAPAG